MDAPAGQPDPSLPRRRPLAAAPPAPPSSPAAAALAYLPLCIVAAFYGVLPGLQSNGGLSALTALVMQVLMASGCAVWVTRDARRRRRVPFFDFGTLVLFTCGLALPIYLIWTRSWRGLAVLIILAAIVAAAALTGAIAAGIVRSFR